MKEIIFSGVLSDKIMPPPTESFDSFYESEQTYEITNLRDASHQQFIKANDEDAVELIFEDGTQWIVPADKIDEVFHLKNRGNSNSESRFVLPEGLDRPGSMRGNGKKILLKFIRLFVKKKVKKTLKDSGAYIDKLLFGHAKDKDGNKRPIAEGLKKVHSDFTTEPIDKKVINSKSHLLFIHGFISNIENAFSGIVDGTIFWASINELYSERVIGFDHYTISKSPLLNAIELLESLPDKINLDIIAHSRGGIVADIIARFADKQSIPFSREELSTIHVSERKYLEKLNQLAESKDITINKIIRVGSPMRGTILLSKRIDHFLNGMLTGLGYISGLKVSPSYNIVKRLLLDIIATKSDTSMFPGIAAMVPDSPFQKVLNSKRQLDGSKLFIIEGDAEIGSSLKQTIAVILTNLFYWVANDFVVNTNSMRYGTLRKDGAYIFEYKSKITNHFSYFNNSESQNAVLKALTSTDEISLKPYEKFTVAQILESEKEAHKNLTRSGDINENELLNYTEDPVIDLVDELFNKTDYKDSFKSPTIKAAIYNGDLKFSDHPVMLGHFESEGILNAEKALDYYMKNALSDHHFLSNYPQQTDENLIILQGSACPQGAIVVGLGNRLSFNQYALRKSVEQGVINYAAYFKDNPQISNGIEKNSITCLCIGSGYGGLSMEASISSILYGIQNANNKLVELNSRHNTNYFREEVSLYTPITNVQFMELYEDKARDAYYALKTISENNYKLELEIEENIYELHGKKKRMFSNHTKDWWHEMVIRNITKDDKINNEIEFISTSGSSRVEVKSEFHAQSHIKKLLERFAKSSSVNLNQSNVIFHLIIPTVLKDILRNQNNIILKLDKKMAEIPWEIIHDKDYDKEPMFVNTGVVRQLISSSDQLGRSIVRGKSALIIGDPKYDNYTDLPAAKEEAEEIGKLLTDNGWQITSLTEKAGYLEITDALFNTKFKILHIAGHGVYDKKTGESGIVIEDLILGSNFFGKLPNIPEFAFINCCYTGAINEELEEKYQMKYETASSIGMKLIEIGVQSVIITGWAVNDAKAKQFAKEFYENILRGEDFGEASKKARQGIYSEDDKTWGAYQCYGDPWYQITGFQNAKFKESKYVIEDEVLTELFNIKSDLIYKKDKVSIIAELKRIFETIRNTHFAQANIIEKIAEIYVELDELDLALEIYEEMFKKNKANHTVKAIEQYWISKIKHTLNENSTKAEKELFINKFKGLLEISKTFERLCLLGGAHKRLVHLPLVDEKHHLEQMRDNYFQAFEMIHFKSAREFTYPLSMALQSSYFYDQGNSIKKSINKYWNTRSIAKVIETCEEKINELEKSKNDFWDDIALVNLKTAELLYTNSKTKIDKIKEEIIQSYSSEFMNSGTYKNIRAEIEHFRFLTSFKSLDKNKIEALHEILNILNNL